MRTLRLGLAVGLAAFGALGAGVAATAGAPVGSNGTPIVAEEMVEKSNTALEQMAETLKKSTDRLERARGDKDLMQYNCINAKLKAIRGLVQIGELSGQALKEAIGQNQAEIARHNFTKIDLARARVEAFRVEIEACVGEQSQYTGGTEIEAIIDPDIRQDDPTEVDILAGDPIYTDRPEIEHPQPATPSF